MNQIQTNIEAEANYSPATPTPSAAMSAPEVGPYDAYHALSFYDASDEEDSPARPIVASSVTAETPAPAVPTLTLTSATPTGTTPPLGNFQLQQASIKYQQALLPYPSIERRSTRERASSLSSDTTISEHSCCCTPPLSPTKYLAPTGKTKKPVQTGRISKSSATTKKKSAPSKPSKPLYQYPLVPVKDFYYPTRPALPFTPNLDPALLSGPPPATTYASLILPQLRELVRLLRFSSSPALRAMQPQISALLSLLADNKFEFGILYANLPGFRKFVEGTLPWEVERDGVGMPKGEEKRVIDGLLGIGEVEELKLVLLILDERYVEGWPRRRGCLIFPDDFE